MASTWDSAYLLGYVKRLAGRTGSDSISDPAWYQRIAEAQNEVVADIAAVCPHVLYPTAPYDALPTLTTTDDQIYTFGSDANGDPMFPMGHGGIFCSLNDIPTSPLRPGVDYMLEGNHVRALNNGTLPATLYWYGIGQPADISDTVQPVLSPEAARELIGLRTVYNFGTEGNRNVELSQTMATRYGYPLGGQPGRFAWWCLTWKTQFARGGALGTWTGMPLALGGYGTQQFQWST